MSKKKNNKKSKIDRPKIGFLPDFSLYLERHFPIEKVYREPAFINKFGNILQNIISLENPIQELQLKALCYKTEKMSPGEDHAFFKKLTAIGIKSATIYPYYLSFGRNGYGIALYLDPTNRHAYFLALDIEHKIRKWHGKSG